MPTLEQVIDEWKADAYIDNTKIGDELMRSPNLHSKYLEFYVFFKGKLTITESKFRKLKWQKEKYWRGEMTKEELEEFGWSQWQRLKPTGSDLSRMFDSDRDLTDLEEKVNYFKTAVSTLEYILKQIQGRDYSIKTLYEYQKYVAGS